MYDSKEAITEGDKNDETPLHIACRMNNFDIVELLLKEKAGLQYMLLDSCSTSSFNLVLYRC